MKEKLVNLSKNLLLLIFFLILSLIIAESVLYSIDEVKPNFTLDSRIPDLSKSISYTDDGEILFNEDDFHNKAGFRDQDEFISGNFDGFFRILMLGDSFTYGAAAVNDGKLGFADVLEKDLNRQADKKTIVWNTGIPGTGQERQIKLLKKYFPVLNPNLVILGFCMSNDFQDNAKPSGRFYVYENGGGWIEKLLELPDGTFKTLTPEEAYLRAYRPHTVLQYLQVTRFFSLVRNVISSVKKSLEFWYGYGNKFGPEKPTREEVNITTQLLKQINDYVLKNNSHFMLLIIPDYIELEENKRSKEYHALINICRQLGIDCIDVFGELNFTDYKPVPDTHWTAEAHAKVGDILSRTVLKLNK